MLVTLRAGSFHPTVGGAGIPLVPKGVVIKAQFVLAEDQPFGGSGLFETLEQLSKLTRGIIETLEAHFKGS